MYQEVLIIASTYTTSNSRYLLAEKCLLQCYFCLCALVTFDRYLNIVNWTYLYGLDYIEFTRLFLADENN